MEKEIGTRALPMKKLYNGDVFAEYLLRYWKWRWEIHALLYATFYKQHETQILIRYNLLSQKKNKKKTAIEQNQNPRKVELIDRNNLKSLSKGVRLTFSEISC